MILITGAPRKAPTASHFMSIVRLEKLLKSGSGSSLRKIIQRAQDMDDLTSALRRELSPDLAENLLSANASDQGDLVLVCSSSAWASRLRFESELLLEAANRHGSPASKCRVTVSQKI